jgi:hypothetical protein
LSGSPCTSGSIDSISGARDHAALQAVRAFHPLPADHPAAVHVGVHLAEEVAGLLDQRVGHVQFEDLLVENQLE